MFLFKNKKKEDKTPHENQVQVLNLDIHVMPERFLGARSHKKDEAKVKKDEHKLEKPEFGLKKNIIIGAILIAVLGSAMAAGAYLFIKSINNENTPKVNNLTDQIEPVSKPESQPVEPLLIQPSPVSIPTSTPISPPPPQVIDLDKDRDLLTTAEEKIFGTDINKSDTDNDGFLDGQEVLNLFDPRFSQGFMLADSSSVRTFVSNEFNYRLFIPTSWTEELIAGQPNQIRFIASTAEFFEVIVEENILDYDSIREWYSDRFPGIDQFELKDIAAQNISGLENPNGLTSYFLNNNYIYILTYNLGLEEDLNFLTTYKMMVKSFNVFENPLAD